MNCGPREAARWRWTVALPLTIALAFLARLATLPPVPDVPDSFLFVAGIRDFSVERMHPHWPGYPVYIWTGKLVTALVGDPVLALHLVSAAACALIAWPLALVARAWALSLGATEAAAERAAWTTGAIWLVVPISWITGAQIVSDPLGLLCGTAMLALCVAGTLDGPGAWIAAAVLGGAMVGVRLVNVTMLAPLAREAWTRRRERWRGWPVPLALAAGLLAGVGPWAAWLLTKEPLAVLVGGGRHHITGHFTGWGESIRTDPAPLERPMRALHTLVTYGLGLDDRALGLAAAAGWLALLVLALTVRPWRTRVSRVIAWWAVPHLVYVFLGHDVAYPRYSLSSVAVLATLAGLATVRFPKAGMVAALVTIVASGATTLPLARRQHREPAVEYRAARLLERQPRAAVVITTRSDLPYFLHDSPGVVYAAAKTPEDIGRLAEAWTTAGRSVFTTAPPPEHPEGWRPVAHFCRDRRIDPFEGSDLWLFAAPSNAAVPDEVVACDAE